MDTLTIASLVLLGLGVGVVVGITSVGAGALMTPILLLDFGSVVGRAFVVGTATTQGTISKFIASARNYYKKGLSSGYLFYISLTGVPLASVGAFYSGALISWSLFPLFLAVILSAVALIIIIQSKIKKLGRSKDPDITRGLKIKSLIIGSVVGLIAGLTGVSTGSILVSSLILVLGFPNRTAVNIAIFEGGLILLAATVTQLYLGHVNLIVTAMLLVGGIPGILIGSHFKDRIDQRLLGYGIAGAILIEAVHTLSLFFLGRSFIFF